MNLEEPQEYPTTAGVSLPRRRRFQYSLRTLFIIVTAVAGVLSWQTYRARQEAITVTKLKELGVNVTYGTRRPQWLWSLAGERLGRTVVSADSITPEEVTAAIPYLKALPNLKAVSVTKYPVPEHPDTQYERQVEAASTTLHREMPNLDIWETVSSGSIPNFETDTGG
jgi:hypothetical protein